MCNQIRIRGKQTYDKSDMKSNKARRGGMRRWGRGQFRYDICVGDMWLGDVRCGEVR